MLAAPTLYVDLLSQLLYIDTLVKLLSMTQKQASIHIFDLFMG